MTTINLFFLSILAMAVVSAIYIDIRNNVVCKVRISFIDDANLFPLAYQKLPNYYSMVFDPRYQVYWTKSDWLEWINKKAVRL